MNIELLRADNLRCFEHISFQPGPHINWFTGPNGAGKTTLLEAAYLLSHGRSFRAGSRVAARRHGARDYLVYAEVRNERGGKARLGLTRADDRWHARRDGADLNSLAPLFEVCPVVYFGPESQNLVLGAAEERRSFLDWSVFHVEHTSLEVWRRWRRALRQRNALIRQDAPAREFEAWEHDLGSIAERIDTLRSGCLDGLEPFIADEAAALVPELGTVHIDYHPGWERETGLARQLAAERDRDRERGFTQHGAHRADWQLSFSGIAQRQHYSRGQAKAAALVCTLALSRWLKTVTGDYPLLCMDDIGAELDPQHVSAAIRWVADKPMQSWFTSTREVCTAPAHADIRVFHVEHGQSELSGGA